MNSPRPWRAYAALVLTTALWGSNPAISRLVMDAVPPVALGWARWFVVVLALLPFMWPERAAIAVALRTRWRTLLLFAVIATAPQSVVVYKGLEHSSAVNLGLFNSTVPVLILVLGALFFGKRIRLQEAAGITVSLVGVLVILFRGSLELALSLSFVSGDLVIFASMLMWSFYTLRIVDRPRVLSPQALVAVMASLGLVVAAPLVLIEMQQQRVAQLSPGALLTIAYIGLGPTLGGMLLYNYAVERVGAVRAGVLVHLMPVFASVFAMLLLGEQVHAFHAGGFALVVSGALLALHTGKPKSGPGSPLLSSRPSET
jgi:drug/metabolite transporter (DMT)-like permease